MNDPSFDDLDGDGVPNVVEWATGTDALDPESGKETRAAMDVAGQVADAVEQTASAAVGQDVVDEITDAVGDMIDGSSPRPVLMQLPEDPPARRVELTDVRDDVSVQDFIVNVLAQVGDRYQRGVDNSLRDADPDAWDGSELVEWGANRAGSMVNDGAQNQYKQMVRHGGDVSIDVALVTPGAVLYEFTGDPNGSVKPTRASTAISLGDGKHIIDIDPVHGVRIVEAKDFTFTHAGVMPGFVDSHNPGAVTRGLVEDALKAEGLEPGPALQGMSVLSTAAPDVDRGAPHSADQSPAESTDDEHGPKVEGSPAIDGGPAPSPTPTASSTPSPPDTSEIAALAGRAAHLRDRYNNLLSSKERVDLVDRVDDIGLQRRTVLDGADWSKRQLADRLKQVSERTAEATELDRRAVEADAAGRGREAEDLREQAEAARGNAKALEALAERSRADIAKAEAEVTRLDGDRAAADERLDQWDASRLAAEKVIDLVEEKVRLLREAEAHEQRAKNYDDDAQWFRDNGDPQEADNRAALAAKARSEADAARTSSRSTDVDEDVLRKGGILTGDETLTGLPPLASNDQTAPALDPGAPQPPIGDLAAALEARSKALRSEYLERQAVDRADDMNEVHELGRQELEARAGADEAKTIMQIRETQAAEARTDATRIEAEAAAAARRGDLAAAEELREQVAVKAASASRLEAIARESGDDAARRLAAAAAIQVERVKRFDEYKEDGKDLTAAEAAIDQIETKARLLRESEAQAKRAVDLESEAALLRDQGKTVEADAKHSAAVQARSAAQQSEALAAAQQIDEAKLGEAGLLDGLATTEAPSAPQASRLDDVTGADATDAEIAGANDADSPDLDANQAADNGADPLVEAPADPRSTDAPPAQIGDVIDAHAAAAALVPDMPDPSQVAPADGDPGSDLWDETPGGDAAPTIDDDTASDLES